MRLTSGVKRGGSTLRWVIELCQEREESGGGGCEDEREGGEEGEWRKATTN